MKVTTANRSNKGAFPAGEQWEFFREQSGRWRWLRNDSDGIFQKAAVKSFDTYGECVENALKSGFMEGCKVIYVPDFQ